jgi:hypothetical protein
MRTIRPGLRACYRNRREEFGMEQDKERPTVEVGTDGTLEPAFACRTCGESIARVYRLEGGVLYLYADPREEGTYWIRDGMATKFPAGESSAYYASMQPDEPRYKRHVEGDGDCA